MTIETDLTSALDSFKDFILDVHSTAKKVSDASKMALQELQDELSQSFQLNEQLETCECNLAARDARIQLLESDMKSGDYEALYAEAVYKLQCFEKDSVNYRLIAELQAKLKLLGEKAHLVSECLFLETHQILPTFTFGRIEQLARVLVQVEQTKTDFTLIDAICYEAKAEVLKEFSEIFKNGSLYSGENVAQVLKMASERYSDQV